MSIISDDSQTQSIFSKFSRVPITEDWFEVYQIKPDLFVFYEAHHYEQTLSSLIVGQEKAILIDTGCGIGNLRKAIEEITDKTVMVVNTHTHTDHLGSNHQFDEIIMFNHPLSHQVSNQGVSSETMQREILADKLVTKAWPGNFDPTGFSLPPFKVDFWLDDGDKISLDNRELLVIHTPGEAADHICLLDKTDRILFCGDILLHGPVWTHLEGGCLQDLLNSYQKLMGYLDEFDYLMPGHNEPLIDKSLLPDALAAAEKIISGNAAYEKITDPWNRKLRKYPFGKFDILTKTD